VSIAKTFSAQLIGLKAEIISVEVDISNGLHAFSIVGLGDRAVDEAKDRVAAAIKNSGYISPKQKNQKVVVSLAPADMRKEGPSFDLAIALAYLKAAREIDFDHSNRLFLGEVSLEGAVRKVTGVLPILCQIAKYGITHAFVPKDNEREASLAKGIVIYAITSLSEIISHLCGSSPLQPINQCWESNTHSPREDIIDISAIRGHEVAKRGLEIAAAGAHNLIMYGPPGTGKTMLAQSFSSILPQLTYEQSVEVTGIHSAAQTLNDKLIIYPPFRAPHHTASYPAIVGGGGFPKPGEITLAHRGVLFLDEFPEFDRSVIEALRQPLEDRTITISRARGTVTFPAQCILLASMNPCPCGKGKENGCTCPQHVLESYKRKMSGPIMDRLDIWLHIHKIDYEKLARRQPTSEDSSIVRARVANARQIQASRYARFGVNKLFNGEMSAVDIEKIVKMTDEARKFLVSSASSMELSGRAFHKTIKVAQTIADLAQKNSIEEIDILEALQYRRKMDGK
jgi:magnesium chelatase family protein